MKFLYSSFLVFLLFSCSSDTTENVCIEYRAASIEKAVPNLTTDATGKTFDIGFRVTDGCGAFFKIEETTAQNVTTIKVVAKYDGCVCTQVASVLETVYVFKQTTPGTYTLKFKKADDSFITETVVIQ